MATGCAITDFEKTHEGRWKCRHTLSFSPSPRMFEKFVPTTGSVFENAGFTNPEVHNTAVIYEIIFHT
ncbi:MAG: hypothetical protein WDM78_22650 [Puia sp.]